MDFWNFFSGDYLAPFQLMLSHYHGGVSLSYCLHVSTCHIREAAGENMVFHLIAKIRQGAKI